MIKTSTSFFWSESDGQIYPALAECVKKGLATCREENSVNAPRTKKIYKITPKGKKELTTWLVEAAQLPTIRNELLLKLFFGKNIDVSESIHHVKSFEKEAKKYLKIFGDIREQIMTKRKSSPHAKYWLITLDYGIKATSAELKWCQETLKSLQAK